MAFQINGINMSLPNTGVRRNKFGFGTFIIMLLAGLAFAGGGLAVAKQAQINPAWARISGHVSGVNTFNGSGSPTYTPVISYTVSGHSYQITSSTSSSSYPAIGSSRQVAYDPSHPEDAKVVSGTGKLLGYALVACGVLAVLGAPILFFRSIHRSHDIKDLKLSGQKVRGIITDIQSNNMTNNSGGQLYRVIVTAPDAGGQAHIYQSDYLQGLGGLAMVDYRTKPIPVDVFLDPANPNKYYVDIDELPSLTADRIQQLISEAAQNVHFQSLRSNPSPAGAQPSPGTPAIAPTALPVSPVLPVPPVATVNPPAQVIAPVTPAEPATPVNPTQPPLPPGG